MTHGQIEPAAAATDGRSARSGAGSPRPVGPAAGPHDQRGEAGRVGDGAAPAGDPDIGTRRVAPARWDDTDAWHEAARAYTDIWVAMTQRPPIAIQPSAPTGRDLAAGIERHGAAYVRRLELLALAARGEPSTPAAHSAIRIARWQMGRDGGPHPALSALRRAEPSQHVASVDESLSEPISRPPEARPSGREESPLDRYLRECSQQDMGEVIDGV